MKKYIFFIYLSIFWDKQRKRCHVVVGILCLVVRSKSSLRKWNEKCSTNTHKTNLKLMTFQWEPKVCLNGICFNNACLNYSAWLSFWTEFDDRILDDEHDEPKWNFHVFRPNHPKNGIHSFLFFWLLDSGTRTRNNQNNNNQQQLVPNIIILPL